MALSPEGLKDALLTSFTAYFDQMQKDVEVRIAVVLQLKDSGLGRATQIAIAQTASREMVGFLRDTAILSGRIDRIVDKLL